MPKPIFEIKDMAFPIQLRQTGHDRFSVTYGKQVKKSLTYGDAAKELGLSVLHALGCEGKLMEKPE